MPLPLDQLRVIKQRHYLDVVASGAVQLRPGVPDLLAELSASGVQQWIVTSSGKASVEALLRSLSTDMRDAFQGMVTADDVEHHKPNPHPYLRALEWSDVSSDHALAVEDSAAGLQSACSARLRCLMTPSAWDQDWQLFSERAQSVVDQLGGEHAPTVLHGPTCAEGRITLSTCNRCSHFRFADGSDHPLRATAETGRGPYGSGPCGLLASSQVGVLSLLIGFIIGSNVTMYWFQRSGQNRPAAVLAMVVILEVMVRLRSNVRREPWPLSWLALDNLRIGTVYAVVLEAFKLGS